MGKEDFIYPDNGCDIAPKCLECPLEACKYDGPEGAEAARRYRLAQRLEAMQSLSDQGLTSDDLADKMGISKRHLYRLKALVKECSNTPAESRQLGVNTWVR